MPRSNSDSRNPLIRWFEDNLTVDQKEDLIFLLSDPRSDTDIFGPFTVSDTDDPSQGNSEAGTDYSTSGSGGGGISGDGLYLYCFGGADISNSSDTTIGIVPDTILSGTYQLLTVLEASTLTGNLGYGWTGMSGVSTVTIKIHVNGTVVQTVTPSISGASGAGVIAITDQALSAGDTLRVTAQLDAGSCSGFNVTVAGVT